MMSSVNKRDAVFADGKAEAGRARGFSWARTGGRLLVIAAVLVVPGGSGAQSGELCVGAAPEVFVGNVVVPAGATCDFGIGGDIIFGGITLEPGASLVKTSGPLHILGDIRATDIATLSIGGCTIMGSVDIDGATGNVSLGSCSVHGGITIERVAGVLNIRNNDFGHRMRVIRNVGAPGTNMDLTNNVVRGDIVINDNVHPLISDVDGNRLTGRLTCTGNEPAPSSSGNNGTLALKGQEGQCADLP